MYAHAHAGVYSPSMTMHNKLGDYEAYLRALFDQDTALLNASNHGNVGIFSLGTPYVNGSLYNETAASAAVSVS